MCSTDLALSQHIIFDLLSGTHAQSKADMLLRDWDIQATTSLNRRYEHG